MSSKTIHAIYGALLLAASPLPVYAEYAGSCQEYFEKNQISNYVASGKSTPVNIWVSWDGGEMVKCQHLDEAYKHSYTIHDQWNCGGRTFLQESNSPNLIQVFDKNNRLWDIVRKKDYQDLGGLDDKRKNNLFVKREDACVRASDSTYATLIKFTEGKIVEPTAIPLVQVTEKAFEYKQIEAPNF